MTKQEAHLKRCCLICGNPGAHLLRLSDGRNVRACDSCLDAGDNPWLSFEIREPLPCEVSP